MINKKLTPFKLCVLQNFPYIEEDFDALTNYQLLCKVVEYLNKTIDSQNEVITEIGQLKNDFIELKLFVEEYLENHLKEDVDAKIDSLVEDGTIEEILSHYIDNNIQRVYNSLNLLKIADLSENTKVRTLGYNNINDGGGAFYIIRNTVPSTYYETLDNGKFAELIINSENNIRQYGAVGNGTNDDSSAFRNAVANATSLIIPDGTYLLNSSVDLNNVKNVIGESTEKTIIKAPNGAFTFTTSKTII